MIDMSKVIEAKSDQLNACDLVGGPKTIKITQVKVSPGADQQVVINYDGDDGRPYKPCIGMVRMMTKAWGLDGSAYVGRYLVLFCNPDVRYGGQSVGGIQISNMSHIDRKVHMPLSISRGKKVAFSVEPLQLTQGATLTPAEAETWKSDISAATTMPELSEIAGQIKAKGYDEADTGRAEVLKFYQAAVSSIQNADAPLD